MLGKPPSWKRLKKSEQTARGKSEETETMQGGERYFKDSLEACNVETLSIPETIAGDYKTTQNSDSWDLEIRPADI